MPMARIFTVIDDLMKKAHADKVLLYDLDPSLPKARVIDSDKMVKSAPITFEEEKVKIYIVGKYDSLLEYEDDVMVREKKGGLKRVEENELSSYKDTDLVRFEGGQRGITDYKTTQVRASQGPKFSSQLSCYKHCLEYAAVDSPRDAIDHLSLMVFEPTDFKHYSGKGAALRGKLVYMNVDFDKKLFNESLRFIARLCSQTEPPLLNMNTRYPCSYCLYAQAEVQESDAGKQTEEQAKIEAAASNDQP